MGLKRRYIRPDFFSGLKFSNNSKEYFDKLRSYQFEEKKVKLEPFDLYPKFFKSDEDYEDIDIDETVYTLVELTLQAANLNEHVNNVCVILKRGFTQKILSEINDFEERDLQVFSEEFVELFKKISSFEFDEIIFRSTKNEGTIKITDTLFVYEIIKLIREKFYLENTLFELADELTFPSKFNKKLKGQTIRLKSVLFELIFYFLHNSNLFGKPADEFVNDPHVSNDVARLFKDLLESSFIVENVEVNHISVNIRRILQLEKHALINLNDAEFLMQNFFREENTHNKIIDKMNELISNYTKE